MYPRGRYCNWFIQKMFYTCMLCEGATFGLNDKRCLSLQGKRRIVMVKIYNN